jgi:catechol 2,3-dioxygenase-like lactoylglutathione lyase family enzyme
MSADHRITAILPCRDLQASTDFYERLGLTLDSDWGHYRILSDGNGWHLHLRHEPGTPQAPDNPFGLYLYAEDVDAIADRVRALIIEPGAPHLKPWGTYEFAVSDPDGTLVRVGREA